MISVDFSGFHVNSDSGAMSILFSDFGKISLAPSFLDQKMFAASRRFLSFLDNLKKMFFSTFFFKYFSSEKKLFGKNVSHRKIGSLSL